MRPYEVMIILDATVDDATVDAVSERVSTVVTAAEGTVGTIDKWGKRRFAYEINKKTEGYYLLVEFSVEPTAIKELDRQLTLADEVVRHKVVRIPDHIAGRERPASFKPSEEVISTDDAAVTGASA